MLSYTAIDLVELIRREKEAAAAQARIHTAEGPGLLQRLRRRLASGRSTSR